MWWNARLSKRLEDVEDSTGEFPLVVNCLLGIISFYSGYLPIFHLLPLLVKHIKIPIPSLGKMYVP
jgi:hypothetical protein